MRFPYALHGASFLLLSASLAAAPACAQAGGHAVPSFAVRTLDGKTFKMSDQVGKPVVLDFWATWCAPCRASMPHFDTIQGRYAREGLVVLGLSVDESQASDVRRFAEKQGYHIRMAMADEKLLDQFGPIRQVPTTFFINRRGEVVRRTVGYLDSETLESYVKELIQP
jgi:thiol-disulfide isomerase/thioredoxin